MKPIYIKGYFNYNFGDDLFLKVISERYPKEKFLVVTRQKYSSEIFKNVSFIQKNYKLDKFIRIISYKNFSFENFYMRKCKFVIYLGGSIFMEEGKSKKLKNFTGNKPYYVVGSNFGPYYSKKYFAYHEKFFEKAEDVCFRDTNSFELFKHKGVRVSPDVVFNLEYDKKMLKDNHQIFISVINLLNRKNLHLNENLYENYLLDVINFFAEKDYKIVLSSFCDSEGDMHTINSLMDKIDENKKSKLIIDNYRGNIDETLKRIMESEYLICSRFHANILALLFRKKFLPIAYSDKTINMLKDVGITNCIDLRNEATIEFSLNDFIDSSALNINEYLKSEQNQFFKLDKDLKRGE